MRYLLSIFLALAPLWAMGAVTIKQANVESSGWVLNVTMGSNDTNGGFNFGFGTNNSGASAIVLSVTSPGYDDTGATNTITRTIYGTKQLRLSYPNQSLNDCTASGADVIIRMALSQCTFSGDSSITMTSASNWYSNNVPATNAMTVVNNSTAAYPKCIANWTYPGWQLVGNPMRLRMVGFHQSAVNGRPLACVQFIVQDTHANKTTNTVTSMTIDRTLPDAVPTGEYIADVSTTVFTNLDLLRCDFIAFPRIGDSTAVFDTTANTYSQVTPMPAAITNTLDRVGRAYTAAIAVVDAAGSDANGRVSTNTDPTAIGSGQYFLSIAKAANQIQATNNNAPFSHNDVGGGIIYIKGTITNWMGASSTYGVTPSVWVTITNYPGDTVSLTTALGNGNMGSGSGRLKLAGITISSGNLFFNTEALWFDHVIWNSAAASAIQATEKAIYLTHSTISNMATTMAINSAPFALIRGNDLSGMSKKTLFYTMIGNSRRGTNGTGFSIVGDLGGQAAPLNEYGILYNNYIAGIINPASTSVDLRSAFGLTNGMAIVQNVFEYCTNGLDGFNACLADGLNYTNLLMWYNDWLGQKTSVAYNWSANATAWRVHFSDKNSIYDQRDYKDDINPTGNAARIGSWMYGFGVNVSGIASVQITNIGVANPFPVEFVGLNGFEPVTGTVNPRDYIQFVLRKSYDGVINAPMGGGDYHLRRASPVALLNVELLLPFDLFGRPRTALNNVPGAYALEPLTFITPGQSTFLGPGTTSLAP